MDPAELRSRVEELEWFHSIDLGGGVVTPGRDDSAAKLARLRLPADLSGRSVLDIGAWDGFFSFEAERRRAERVLAVDTLAWERGEKSGRPCFELAHRALGSRVESRRLDVHDVATAGIGRFDLVLCLGVLYHLREPLRALEAVATNTTTITQSPAARVFMSQTPVLTVHSRIVRAQDTGANSIV